mmetsp:Transcript_100875/g.179052  ORF Transcript_100875/g.179052 Transcript_100875/m.179052 type:complete len:126 (+) Transcript_100875:3-380(+)
MIHPPLAASPTAGLSSSPPEKTSQIHEKTKLTSSLAMKRARAMMPALPMTPSLPKPAACPAEQFPCLLGAQNAEKCLQELVASSQAEGACAQVACRKKAVPKKQAAKPVTAGFLKTPVAAGRMIP